MMKKLLLLMLFPVLAVAQVPFRSGILVDTISVNLEEYVRVPSRIVLDSSLTTKWITVTDSMGIGGDDYGNGVIAFYNTVYGTWINVQANISQTANRDLYLPITGGTVAHFANSGFTTAYEGNVTPAVVDLFSASGLTADSAASASNTTTAGIYRISVYTDWSADDADGSTLDVTVTWENSASVSTTATTTEISTTGTKYATHTYTVYHDGTTAITYAADLTRSGGTETYALRVVVERLN